MPPTTARRAVSGGPMTPAPGSHPISVPIAVAMSGPMVFTMTLSGADHFAPGGPQGRLLNGKVLIRGADASVPDGGHFADSLSRLILDHLLIFCRTAHFAGRTASGTHRRSARNGLQGRVRACQGSGYRPSANHF
jgi:hypothetical protein